MDNNNTPSQPTPAQPNVMPNPIAANPVVPTPAQPAPVQSAIPPASNTAPEKGSNKILLWFITGIVIIVLAVGGFYLYSSRQQAVESGKEASTTSTPVPVAQENLEMELNNINIDVIDSDFVSLDQDLQQL